MYLPTLTGTMETNLLWSFCHFNQYMIEWKQIGYDRVSLEKGWRHSILVFLYLLRWMCRKPTSPSSHVCHMCQRGIIFLTIYYWFIDNQVLSLKSLPGLSVTSGFVIDVKLLRQKKEGVSLATQEFGSYTTVIANRNIEVSEKKRTKKDKHNLM